MTKEMRSGNLRPTPEVKFKLKKAGLTNRTDYINRQSKGFQSAVTGLSKKYKTPVTVHRIGGHPDEGETRRDRSGYHISVPASPKQLLQNPEHKRFVNPVLQTVQHEKSELKNSLRLDKKHGTEEPPVGHYYNPTKHGLFVDAEKHASPRVIKDDIEQHRENAFYGVKNKSHDNARYDSGVLPAVSKIDKKDIRFTDKFKHEYEIPINTPEPKYKKEIPTKSGRFIKQESL
jgi:hypothetical protein